MQGRQRGRSTGPISNEANIALEIAHGVKGLMPEDAVNAPRVKTHARQSLLQLSDVIAAKQVADLIAQQAIAQGPVGFIEGSHGVRPNNAVNQQPTLLLKVTNSEV
jgi:hypothetical protein